MANKNKYEDEADRRTKKAQKYRHAGHRQNVADDRKEAASEAQREADEAASEAEEE